MQELNLKIFDIGTAVASNKGKVDTKHGINSQFDKLLNEVKSKYGIEDKESNDSKSKVISKVNPKKSAEKNSINDIKEDTKIEDAEPLEDNEETEDGTLTNKDIVLSVLQNIISILEDIDTSKLDDSSTKDALKECRKIIEDIQDMVVNLKPEEESNILGLIQDKIEKFGELIDSIKAIKNTDGGILLKDDLNDLDLMLKSLKGEIVKDNTTAEKSNESVNNKSVFNSRYDVKNGETSGDNDKEVLNSSTKADENQLKVSQEVDRQPETENSSKMEMSEENNQSKDGAEEEANIKESKGESFLSLIKNDNTVSKESDVFKNDIPQVNKENIIEQVAEKIKILVNDGNEGKQEVRIKLKPEILGELVLKVEVEKGVVVARAVVDNFRTKELLEMNISQLQEGLKEQGLDIKTFSVYVGNNSDFEKEGKNNFFSNKRNKKVKMKNVNLEGIGNYDASMFVENLSNTEVGKLDLMA